MRTVLHDGTVVWQDRHGHRHHESRPTPIARRTDTSFRVFGPLEGAWVASSDRQRLTQQALDRPNPSFDEVSPDNNTCLWTWVVEAPEATPVLLWMNPVFDHTAVETAELTRLPDSDLWTICLRLPTSLRASYRLALWKSDECPPWRVAGTRREIIVAARDAGSTDPRGLESTVGPGDRPTSIAHGPSATREIWRSDDAERTASDDAAPNVSVDHLSLKSGANAWVYAPRSHEEPTPLLVVFDGRTWKDMGLASLVDQAITAGALPAVHLAMLDLAESQDRGEHLGIPGGQVDVLLDELLPRVRSEWNVVPSGEGTVVAGQSLGGIAALWTLALSDGEVAHAIAQSPSLWRFDMAEPLLAAPKWQSIRLQAGAYEHHMIDTTQRLDKALRSDDRLQGRTIQRAEFTGGHGWAAWRAELVATLAEVLQG